MTGGRIKSSNRADWIARSCDSSSGSVPRWLSARTASLMVSRRYRVPSSSRDRPFSPGRAPGAISDLSRWSSAACGRLRTMYGHMDSMSGPIARPLTAHSHEGRALAAFGMCGPVIDPPANARHVLANTSVVVPIEITAAHADVRLSNVIMYDPSPSRSPARYAACSEFMGRMYHGLVTNTCYGVAGMR